MYYQIKPGIIFRNYGNFGFLTSNRNYRYKKLNEPPEIINDLITSESGAAFLSVLTWIPQSIDVILNKLCKLFPNIDRETLVQDAYEYYSSLIENSFIASGNTPDECQKNALSSHHPYNTHRPESAPQSSTSSDPIDIDSYFDNRPQLTRLHIEITSQCNERCVHCYIPHHNKTNAMPSEMLFDILEQAKKLNVINITISGGEPLSHPDFLNFLKKCNLYNMSVNILSNLTLLTPEIIDEMKQNPLLSVQTSIYSMDETIHDTITNCPGSLTKTKTAVLLLLRNNIPVQISCPIMKQNKHCFRDVIQWGKQHSIQVNSDYVIIARYDHSTDNINCRLCEEDIKEIIKQDYSTGLLSLEETRNEYETKKNMQAEDYICSVCSTSLCISETGNVYPCAGWQDYVLANINDYTLYEIWNKSKKIKYLRNLRRCDIPECLECDSKESCSVCLVRNANENPLGNPLIPNKFFCNVAKIHKQVFETNSGI